jgi:hypothetical protein
MRVFRESTPCISYQRPFIFLNTADPLSLQNLVLFGNLSYKDYVLSVRKFVYSRTEFLFWLANYPLRCATLFHFSHTVFEIIHCIHWKAFHNVIKFISIYCKFLASKTQFLKEDFLPGSSGSHLNLSFLEVCEDHSFWSTWAKPLWNSTSNTS